MKDTIDFMVVGIGRCGTTTLFEHLKRHPDIFVPKYKECPFIAGETKTEYMRRHFPKDYKGKIIGAVTPQWMEYPQLFRRWFPDARVLMITRDPKERTESHIRMLKRRGEEVDIKQVERMSDYEYWKHIWKCYGDLFTTDLQMLIEKPTAVMQSIYDYIRSSIPSTEFNR